MDMEKKYLKMETNMLVNIKMENLQEKVDTNGRMAQVIKAILKKEKEMVLAFK